MKDSGGKIEKLWKDQVRKDKERRRGKIWENVVGSETVEETETSI
jgi:hypothetical protein